jgi:hemoglobin
MKTLCLILVAAALGIAAPALADTDTLYADMGGQAGIDRLVDASVDNYLADDRIKAIFDQSNMDRIRAEFKVQFCQIAGGPCTYTGHSMAAAHKGLHLTNANFNAVVEDLQAAMTSCNIPFATQNRFLARLAPYQHEVVTR